MARRALLIILPLLSLLLLACDEDAPSGDLVRFALEPAYGSNHGGETVTVRGDGFDPATEVFFAGAASPSVTWVSARELTVETPPGTEGQAEVLVACHGDPPRRFVGGFWYQDPALSPTLASCDHPYGLVEGGEAITVTGTGFQPGATLTLNDVTVPDTAVQSGTTITAVTPALAAGEYDVVVVNPDQRMASIVRGYVACDLEADEYEVLNLLNAERTAQGLLPVKPHPILALAAEYHCQDMIDRDFFDHYNPDGDAPWDRAMELGYPSGSVGENIAGGYWTPAAVMTAWMNSPGHRANILNAGWTEVGVGMRLGGSYGIYWAQVFGRR